MDNEVKEARHAMEEGHAAEGRHAMKEKKNYGDNEAPLFRWLLALAFGLIVGGILGSAFYMISLMIPAFRAGGYLECELSAVQAFAIFSGIYIGLLLGIRIFCRTSMRTFLFGKDRRPDVKAMLVIAVLMLIGDVLSDLHSLKYISLNRTQPVPVILFNIVFVLAFLWMQTTTEEIVFRGFFLRVPYGNRIPVLPKGLGFALISSLLFMSLHMSNPEMRALSGAELIMGASNYFLAGLFMYIGNLLIGGMEAGVTFHYVNNFYVFVILSEVVTAVPTPTIFVKEQASQHSGMWALLSVLMAYGMPMIYLIVRYRKKTIKTTE